MIGWLRTREMKSGGGEVVEEEEDGGGREVTTRMGIERGREAWISRDEDQLESGKGSRILRKERDSHKHLR